MNIVADTNILVRATADDDAVQGPLAQAQLADADLVALTLPALCELAWVFLRGYKVSRMEFAETLRVLLSADNVKVDPPAVETGLAFLEDGGDFADGVIAHERQWLGSETFVSFDGKAVQLLAKRGIAARIPA